MMKAVVLAGGNRTFSLREFCNQIIDLFTYGAWYFRRDHKCMWRIPGIIEGKAGKHPMVEYIINSIEHSPSIDEVLAVGPWKEHKDLECHLRETYQKVRFIQQGESIGENALLGYNAAGRQAAIYCTADAPHTSSQDIEEFARTCATLRHAYDIILPIVSERVMKRATKPERTRIGAPPQKASSLNARCLRGYFAAIPDITELQEYRAEDGFRDTRGREGYRVTSMLYADLAGIDAATIDEMYSLRKMFRPSVRSRLREILGDDALEHYFRGMRISHAILMAQEYLHERTGTHKQITAVGMSRPTSEFDIDSRFDLRKAHEEM